MRRLAMQCQLKYTIINEKAHGSHTQIEYIDNFLIITFFLIKKRKNNN